MRTVRESARDVPVIAEVDVLVVGSGPGGLGAAGVGHRRQHRQQEQVAEGRHIQPRRLNHQSGRRPLTTMSASANG
jgi:hypothetical protein